VVSGAPGSILSVYGSNLAAVTADLSGFFWLTALPAQLNGVSVKIGGLTAPIYFVSPGLINVQTPYEVGTGNRDVAVTNAAGTTIAHVSFVGSAPSIFIVDVANNLGAIVKSGDFSLVTARNPVKGGDALVIYSSGLGQTTPPVITGAAVVPPAAGMFQNTVPVTVSMAGYEANVLYSIAAPGFIGVYQTAAVVPMGLSGVVPLILKAGSAASNLVNVAVE
jgi:uncharacterized protein (TIGR03437 family)